VPLARDDRTRAHSLEPIGPGETLARANRRLYEHQRATTRFATAIAAVIDCRRRTMRIAVAGHPPAILLRPGEPARALEAEGSLLGVFPDERYEEIEIALEPNDRVLFYSDGFEYVHELRRVAASEDAGETIRMVEDLLELAGGTGRAGDDLTLVCVHATASGAIRLAA